MHLAEILIGVLFCIGAVIAVIIALDRETVIALGAAVILGGLGSYGIYTGIHGYHSHFYAKHQAIVRDLNRQGIRVASGDVNSRGGYYLASTSEADVHAGSCVFPLIARKIGGVWRVVLPNAGTRSSSGGVVILTAADVAKLARACP